MQTRTILLAGLATLLVGLAIMVHVGGAEEGWTPDTLDAAALASLQPDAIADARLLDHLRALTGVELAAWKSLTPAGQALFATLWAEEVQRTGSWAQMAEMDLAECSGPTVKEIADAYDALGLAQAAQAVRRLAVSFERERAAIQAWIAARRDGRDLPRPIASDTEAAARAAFGQPDRIRAARLAFARDHADEIDIR